MDERLKVLFIPRWYPHRDDPMEGLFVQRQAEALARFCHVVVIHIHPVYSGEGKTEAVFTELNGVRVLQVYLKTGSAGNGWSKAWFIYKYYRASMRAVRSIRQFRPDIVHGHILTRAGVVAWRAAAELGAPFIISEHWSRYFPQNFSYTGRLRKLLTRMVITRSAALIPVSERLKQSMEQCGLSHEIMPVVPNIVDTEQYVLPVNPMDKDTVTFLHVSCFDDRSKNLTGFLRSVKSLSESCTGFRCMFIGAGPDLEEVKDYARFLNIPEHLITFTGLLEGDVLVSAMQQADFTVVSSRYETFGTVIIESLSCGTPVLSTRVGVAAELITEENGWLVEPDNESEMSAALAEMLENCRKFNRERVRRSISDRFNIETVGRQLLNIYQSVLQKGS